MKIMKNMMKKSAQSVRETRTKFLEMEAIGKGKEYLDSIANRTQDRVLNVINIENRVIAI